MSYKVLVAVLLVLVTACFLRGRGGFGEALRFEVRALGMWTVLNFTYEGEPPRTCTFKDTRRIECRPKDNG